MAYKLDDKVETNTGLQGTIVYIEDDLIYIETSSGAEHEFHLSDLVPLGTKSKNIVDEQKRPFDRGPAPKKFKPTVGMLMSNPLLKEESARTILEHMDLVIPLTEKFHNNLNHMLKNEHTWEDTTNLQKLNVLAARSGRPVKTFFEALVDNKLNALQLAILASVAEELQR